MPGGLKPVAPPWLFSGLRSMNHSMSRACTSNSCCRTPRDQIAQVCWYSGTPMRLPRRSAGAAMVESLRTMMLVWKNLRMVNTGIATQRVSPREAAMMSEDIDISDTSNSAKRSCRQNISDGCTTVMTGLIPCGTTRPSISGRVRSLSESAMLSSSGDVVIGRCNGRVGKIVYRSTAAWAKARCDFAHVHQRRVRLCPPYAPQRDGRTRCLGRRHADIDAVVAHLHVDRPQAIFRVAAVAARLEVELPTVPGTDDVAPLGETKAAAGLVRRKLFLDARDHFSLTDRAAVVRAMILIGDEAVALAENSDLERVDPQHAIAPFHELAELAHHDLVHRFTLACPITRAPRAGTTFADRRS